MGIFAKIVETFDFLFQTVAGKLDYKWRAPGAREIEWKKFDALVNAKIAAGAS